MYFLGDSTFIILIPAILLSLYATFKVQSAFRKYSQVRSHSGLTGSEAGKMLLRAGGLNVPIREAGGFLGDYYDPLRKELRLSPDVYGTDSIAALGVAAHEVGHAYQHADGYFPVMIRSALVPAANIGSMGAPFLFMIGLFIRSGFLMDLAILFFALAVAFYLVTLPVEFNASRRAVAMLAKGGFVTVDEERKVREVLNAAALTYVAAALMAVLQLIRFMLLRERE